MLIVESYYLSVEVKKLIVQAKEVKPYGFLKDYPKFKEGPSKGADWVYIKEGAYPLVDKPGPDVLRIRFAITDIVPSKPALLKILLSFGRKGCELG